MKYGHFKNNDRKHLHSNWVQVVQLQHLNEMIRIGGQPLHFIAQSCAHHERREAVEVVGRSGARAMELCEHAVNELDYVCAMIYLGFLL